LIDFGVHVVIQFGGLLIQLMLILLKSILTLPAARVALPVTLAAMLLLAVALPVALAAAVELADEIRPVD
jgi:hypothetical protein